MRTVDRVLGRAGKAVLADVHTCRNRGRADTGRSGRRQLQELGLQKGVQEPGCPGGEGAHRVGSDSRGANGDPHPHGWAPARR